MAYIGEMTSNAIIADLRKMLGKLDPKLFGSSEPRTSFGLPLSAA